MATPTSNQVFANELLIMIAKDAPLEALAALRLTNRLFHDIVTPRFVQAKFTTIKLDYGRRSMHNLTEITAHPYIGLHVFEIITSATKQVSIVEEVIGSTNKLPINEDGNPITILTRPYTLDCRQWNYAHAQYFSKWFERQDIWTFSKRVVDQKALEAAHPLGEVRYLIQAYMNMRRFLRVDGITLGVQPTEEIFGLCENRFSDAVLNHVRAAVYVRLPIRSLDLHFNSKVPLEFDHDKLNEIRLMPSMPMWRVRNASLIVDDPDVANPQDLATKADDLWGLINDAQNLESLTIKLNMSTTFPDPYLGVTQVLVWPGLQTITLSHLRSTGDGLADFLWANRATLRQVSLSNIILDMSGPFGWGHVLRMVPGNLWLRKLSLRHLTTTDRVVGWCLNLGRRGCKEWERVGVWEVQQGVRRLGWYVR